MSLYPCPIVYLFADLRKTYGGPTVITVIYGRPTVIYGGPMVIYGISLAQDYLFARFLQML